MNEQQPLPLIDNSTWRTAGGRWVADAPDCAVPLEVACRRARAQWRRLGIEVPRRYSHYYPAFYRD